MLSLINQPLFMDILTTIFGNYIKVRILRLFLFNPETPFFLTEIVDRTKCNGSLIRKELSSLLRIGFLKKRLITKEVLINQSNKPVAKKIHGLSYALNNKFVYIDQLKNFLTVSSVSADDTLLKKFSNVGRLKLLIASGVFIQNWDSRVDLLLVGDELDLRRIENAIKGIEAEIGKEIAYSAFDTHDFEYRLGIHDRLIRDILDYPHVTLLDRLGVESN